CLAGVVATGLVALTVQVTAQQTASPPDFTKNGWIGVGGDFLPVPGASGPAPMTNDPKYPYVPNQRGSGVQPTYRIADLSHPNLKPWVKERMKKDNDEVVAGKIALTPRSSRTVAGLPGFNNFGRAQPDFLIQSPSRATLV